MHFCACSVLVLKGNQQAAHTSTASMTATAIGQTAHSRSFVRAAELSTLAAKSPNWIAHMRTNHILLYSDLKVLQYLAFDKGVKRQIVCIHCCRQRNTQCKHYLVRLNCPAIENHQQYCNHAYSMQQQ
jgi:hypothetical protein